jgi:glucose/arabinose dehydrogenase
MTKRWMGAIGLVVLAACGGKQAPEAGAAAAVDAEQPAKKAGQPFVVTEIAKFNEPWAMTFLPDGRLLVTERKGVLQLYSIGGSSQEVTGLPVVAYGGQGGLGDVVLHPKFAENRWAYFSYAEPGDGDVRGAAVARAKLEEQGGQPALTEFKVIWRQEPKVTGMGHFGHRIAFDRDGYLWISSGERQKFDPAQDMKSNLGKIVRLTDEGLPAADNPFADQGGVTAQIWSLGHRNPLGLAFDSEGRLWNHEMGPEGGDELNLVKRGANYGYPVVSEGNHYGGAEIPNHVTHQEFEKPAVTWLPVISPAGFVIYGGSEFPDWRGDGFIGGLSSEALIRVEFDGETAKEAERYPMSARIREVEQGPEGALWILEDERDGKGGRLLKLTAPK